MSRDTDHQQTGAQNACEFPPPEKPISLMVLKVGSLDQYYGHHLGTS